jgi:hypothetical protein
MIVLKYLLEFLGFAMLAAAAVLVTVDLVNYYRRSQPEIRIAPREWRLAGRLAAGSLIPMLMGLSIAVIPREWREFASVKFRGRLQTPCIPGCIW